MITGMGSHVLGLGLQPLEGFAMRILYVAIALCLLVTCVGSTHAQNSQMGIFSLNYSLPVSDTEKYISNDSWLGASFEGRFFPKSERLSLGADFGWNEFYNTTSEGIDFGSGSTGGTVSGKQYRHLNAFPMLATCQYYFGQKNAARPYLGLGIGTYYIRQFTDIGLYTVKADGWHFGLSPEFGVVIPTSAGYGMQAVVSLRYHYPVKAGDYISGSQSFSYWALGVGVSWERW